MGGEMNMAAGIQVAQLALKHRQNKNQQQRIIVFAGSPVKYDKRVLEVIGKTLKKNSVALDIVNFGEEDGRKPEKLEALLSAVNNNDSSHIVHIPPGPNALSDVLISLRVYNPLLLWQYSCTQWGGGGSELPAAAGGNDFDFGVDPNLDPELALALRVSMEEERARQEAAAKRAAEESARQEKAEEPSSNSQDATMVDSADDRASEASGNNTDPGQAITLSMQTPGHNDPSVHDVDMSEATHEDEELAIALQMSRQDDAKDSSSQSDMSKALEDQSFVSSVLASLPGVDPNDPSVKDLLASLQGQSESKQKKKEDEPPNDEK
ncbi:hypothetical protein GH714_030051 [Hevea brasiliensis]|uniref:VWFA domain-containing protein n=1 Tax=Hevea brasiliensis TaxID=3981 RepID=A0A6A6N959_HEVBR|nr:hypothetical protein GH714_030051 [Hevea brasiliensis]